MYRDEGKGCMSGWMKIMRYDNGYIEGQYMSAAVNGGYVRGTVDMTA